MSHFTPDVLGLQLLLPHYPHVVLDGRFNCSPRYGNPTDPHTRIVHYHGNRHLERYGEASADSLWIQEFSEVFARNLADVRSWSPAGDGRLQESRAVHRRVEELVGAQ